MIKIGIIGMSPGNGHPYSWSAIINGYDPQKMSKCPFPVIPEYLAKNDPSAKGAEDLREAKITHIWTQDRKISQDIADASLIENVTENITDMIGEVDAVILARDDGENHLEMARPFIEADIPIFIDKPLTDNIEDLRTFIQYYETGKRIISCSSMRYSQPLIELKNRKNLGCILTAHSIAPKLWRTYGIHLIEGIYTVMGGGIESVQNIGRQGEEIVHILYNDGRHALLQTFKKIHSDIEFAFYGEKDSIIVKAGDAYFSFKNTLLHFVEMIKTGKPPFKWEETVEMTRIVIAGQLSLEQKGRLIHLREVV